MPQSSSTIFVTRRVETPWMYISARAELERALAPLPLLEGVRVEALPVFALLSDLGGR